MEEVNGSIPIRPPNNPLQINRMLEGEHSLLSVVWCHLGSNAENAYAESPAFRLIVHQLAEVELEINH